MNHMKILIIVLVLIAIIIFTLAYRTIHFDYGNDKFIEKNGKSLGFEEKVYTTFDESKISYLEGPDNGDPLLMIHGQMVSKENYAKVLGDLCKYFHIYAVDCYGHGKSSKDPKKYNINSIRDDLIDFMKDVIGEKTYITGHSSGALIAAAIAAKNRDQVKGLILEDGPFFSTEKGRAKNTFSYLEFKNINDFLSQDTEKNYTRYYLDHTYMKEFFNKDGKDNWTSLVKDPFSKRIKVNSYNMPTVRYYPPELGLNKLIHMTRNMQDGTGNYDLRFGQAFFDFTFFENFDQREELRKISCPTIILHVAPPKETAPSYYDHNHILLSAMDEEDAQEVHSLIENSILKSGHKSSHNIHDDLPKDFVESIMEIKQYTNEKKLKIVR